MIENLVFRQATPADKPAMAAICAQIWEGDDYIPYVWDKWMAEPYGQLSVVELDGKVIALGKLTRLAPEEWWLEGLRVDPAYQKRGIGHFLHDQGVALADRIGSGVLRFATSSKNKHMAHLAELTGFTVIGDYALFKGAALSADPDAALGATAEMPGDTGTFTPLAKPDLRLVEHFLGMSERFTATQYLFEHRWWTWQSLTLDLLDGYIERGDLLGWRMSRGALGGLALIHPYSQEENGLIVSYADAPGALLTALARDLRRLAAERSLAFVNWKPFVLPDALAALEAAGYENTWENVLRVYERPIRPGA
jgi:GNAT superfamily N-acetyltransferase